MIEIFIDIEFINKLWDQKQSMKQNRSYIDKGIQKYPVTHFNLDNNEWSFSEKLQNEANQL